MKTLTIFLGLFLMTLTMQAQKVITVDNRPNTGPDVTNVHYASLATAISDASVGDIIQIHPSATSYNNVTINKRLTLVGLSHNPLNSKSGEKAIVGNITFGAASANSVVTGLQINIINTTTHTDVSGIRIVNNRINNYVLGSNSANGDNWVIEGNIFTNAYVYPYTSVNGWIIKNNIFDQASQWVIQFMNDQTSFLNNIIITTSGNFANTCTDTVINNNIFILEGPSNTTVDLNSSTLEFNNCLTYNKDATITILSGNNNLDNTNPGFAFAIADIDDYYNNNYNVNDIGQIISPVGAGTDGTDVGVFGAMFNFDPQGRPDDYPYMTSLDISNSSVPMGQNIDVTFTAEKKN